MNVSKQCVSDEKQEQVEKMLERVKNYIEERREKVLTTRPYFVIEINETTDLHKAQVSAYEDFVNSVILTKDFLDFEKKYEAVKLKWETDYKNIRCGTCGGDTKWDSKANKCVCDDTNGFYTDFKTGKCLKCEVSNSFYNYTTNKCECGKGTIEKFGHCLDQATIDSLNENINTFTNCPEGMLGSSGKCVCPVSSIVSGTDKFSCNCKGTEKPCGVNGLGYSSGDTHLVQVKFTENDDKILCEFMNPSTLTDKDLSMIKPNSYINIYNYDLTKLDSFYADVFKDLINSDIPYLRITSDLENNTFNAKIANVSKYTFIYSFYMGFTTFMKDTVNSSVLNKYDMYYGTYSGGSNMEELTHLPFSNSSSFIGCKKTCDDSIDCSLFTYDNPDICKGFKLIDSDWEYDINYNNLGSYSYVKKPIVTSSTSNNSTSNNSTSNNSTSNNSTSNNSTSNNSTSNNSI
jgi:hypothetical protein